MKGVKLGLLAIASGPQTTSSGQDDTTTSQVKLAVQPIHLASVLTTSTAYKVFRIE